MANEAHLERLRRGVTAWNAWREENPEIKPDLREAHLVGIDHLCGVDLRKANLYKADLHYTDLFKANLSMASCERADLRGADLREANLHWADLTEARRPTSVFCVCLNYRQNKEKVAVFAFPVPKGTETSIDRYSAPVAA
jgi:hypothetical protein